MFQTWNLLKFWGHGLRMFSNISPAFEMTVDTSAAARLDVQPFVSPLTSHTVWKHLQQFMQCRGQSMPNWSHQRDWAMNNQNISQFWKSTKNGFLQKSQKNGSSPKKKSISWVISVSCSLQPTNPKQKPHRCSLDTLGLRSPTKNGGKEKNGRNGVGIDGWGWRWKM